MQFPKLGKMVKQMMRSMGSTSEGTPSGAAMEALDIKSHTSGGKVDNILTSVSLENSGLFDRGWYLATYEDVALRGVDPLDHYLSHGWREGRSPSAFFDTRWYLSQYNDVAEASIDPLRHYLIYGQFEGRVPNPFFDAKWYESTIKRSPDERKLTPYTIYLRRGLAEGHPPLPELQTIFGLRGKVSENAYDEYKRLITAMRPWWERFGRGKTSILLALFSPYQDSTAMNGVCDDAVEKLIGFLEQAWAQSVDPGPFFQAAYYERILRSRGMEPQPDETLLQHFLREGVDLRIIPTECFDEAAYYQLNLDITPDTCWGFEHFIRWGVFEGRRMSRAPRLVLTQLTAHVGPLETRINNWKYFLATCGSPQKLDGIYRDVASYTKIIDDIFHASIFAEAMQRAVQIDPAIGDPSDISEVLVPPFHDARNIARRSLRARLPRHHYDTIVCVPWIRTGGADLVACQISTAIQLARKDESILILRTDQPNFDRPEWVPEGADVVDASDIFKSILPIDAQILLYGLIKGLSPKRVINVNSRLCWDTLARFGSRLANSTYLYSYLFCWDQTPRNYRVGYPSEFFPETAHNLHAVFTDTVYLKNELTKIYHPPAHVRDRIVPLFSPAKTEISGPTMTEESIKRAGSRRRWKVLWAGRLDRQKRFDLVQEIARAMPDVDFVCWGSAILDAPPDLKKTPSNLVLHDGFSSYNDLPLRDAELWLFTSEWEGMPTILIELAHRGVCVVASSVGGVPELIDEQTGWPVNNVRSIDAYVSAIREALRSPGERVIRATKLRERARTRHTMVSYVRQISDVLSKEGNV
ncbi:MAG TPA: glycosyltransferase family 4 protein [Dyella sp.]|uniref:glycosyltransferase family 4 protein n=1 Tax=Dyella sp. TaxID=1869338 RepID=UPI002C017B34|nr:glycosyltransferase family 4 protein [Dyella sp.]HUB88333.1 glycosyltransferase family 4 protein [Dyella sp.]